MDKTGYSCPICGSTDTVFVLDDEESEYNDLCDDVNVECLRCGYVFIVDSE